MSERKQHPLQGVMETAMKELKEMVDVNTIIGNPISAGDGTVIIPVSKVGFGFASGGSDFTTKAHQPPNKPEDANLCFGGGSGAGVTINPVAFLVVNSKGEVSLIPMDQSEASTLDRVIDKMPTIIEKTKEAFSKKKDKEYTDLGD